MAQVAAVKTPVADLDLIAALQAAWRTQLGAPATNASIAVLCAQVALETAHGCACIQWNIGNSKAYAGVDYCQFETVEYIDGKPTSMVQSFAAYGSLAEGVAVYLRSMWNRWKKAWPSVVAGDPRGFAQGLHDDGYYTAPVDNYAAGVARWFGYYEAKLGGDASVTEPEMSSRDIAFLLPDVEPSDPGA